MSQFVRTINGVTFINEAALWNSLGDTPAPDRLRQLMINAGVDFFDAEKTIVAKPVVGIRAIGGFPITFDENTPEGQVELAIAPGIRTAATPEQLMHGLRESMGAAAMPTYMNPNNKTAAELYDVNVKAHGVPSVAHTASLSFAALGLSQQAEQEFDTQRDIVHLARLTTARTHAQDAPALVAQHPAMVEAMQQLRDMTTKHLESLTPPEGVSGKDWLEMRNSAWPAAKAMTVDITGSLKNLGKLVSAMDDPGKETEYRNLLALMNDSLHGLAPELFKPSHEMGHAYPAHWQATPDTQISGGIVCTPERGPRRG